MKPNNKCPKCGGEFEEGEMNGSHLALHMEWGSQRKLTGTLRDSKTIKSYRCKNCAYLENYAS